MVLDDGMPFGRGAGQARAAMQPGRRGCMECCWAFAPGFIVALVLDLPEALAVFKGGL
jgi:hypothetical protein